MTAINTINMLVSLLFTWNPQTALSHSSTVLFALLSQFPGSFLFFYHRRAAEQRDEQEKQNRC